MRVLITGAAGFIGANLVRYCREREWDVIPLDNLEVGRSEYLEGIPGASLVRADILDRVAVEAAVDGVDAVVHLAAQSGVQESVRDPEKGLRVNGLGTLGLLQACHSRGVRRFVFASTGGAIAGDQGVPVHERMVPQPISPYGASKLTGEAYVHVFAKTFGLSTVSLRFSNVYGPWSAHKKNAIPTFIRAIAAHEPLTIYGDGENTRDFLFVGDLVKVIADACERDLSGQPIQLGTGQETSVNQLVQVLGRATGRAPLVRYEAGLPGEVRRNYADISVARELLGFSPKVTLEDGLNETWEWFVSRRTAS